jgi:hypothetical protein
MSNESHNSISVPEVNLRDVQLHMLQAKLLLQRHCRQIVDGTKANRLARLIDRRGQSVFRGRRAWRGPAVRPSRVTQRGKILELLVSVRGQEVPLPKIVACAAQYNARISELRELGFRIPPPRRERVDGQVHTWYRLESTPRIETITPTPALGVMVNTGSFPEFGNLAKETYGVD